jgi:hypothetical protein
MIMRYTLLVMALCTSAAAIPAAIGVTLAAQTGSQVEEIFPEVRSTSP